MNTLWTERDLAIVETLTTRIRMMTLEQLVRVWWPKANNNGASKRRLRKLTEAGMIEQRIVNVSCHQTPDEPRFHWLPGGVPPNADDIVGRRADSPASVSMHVVNATKLAANLFGSTVYDLPELHRRRHETALAFVYTHFAATRPRDAERWNLTSDADVSADAWLVDSEQRPQLAIKLVSAMTPEHIVKAHERFASTSIPYELW